MKVWPLVCLVYASLAIAIATPSCISQDSRKPDQQTENRIFMNGYNQGYNAAGQAYEPEILRLREETKKSNETNARLERDNLRLRADNFNLELELKVRQESSQRNKN